MAEFLLPGGAKVNIPLPTDGRTLGKTTSTTILAPGGALLAIPKSLAPSAIANDPCALEAAARAKGQDAAIIKALAAKCAAAKAAKPFTAGASTSLGIASGADVAAAATGLDPIIEDPRSGPSPVLIGAIAVGVGVVGLLAYRSMKRKKR